MGKFLELCEEFDPKNNGDPKWELVDFLKSKGVNVSIVRETDMIYIDTGSKTIAVTVSVPDEDESINAGTGTYEVDQEVEKLGSTASGGLQGLAAKKIFGTSAQKAKTAVKKRQNVAKKAVDAYDKGTQRIEKGLQSIKSSAIGKTY